MCERIRTQAHTRPRMCTCKRAHTQTYACEGAQSTSQSTGPGAASELRGLKDISPPGTALSASAASSVGLTTALSGDEALALLSRRGTRDSGEGPGARLKRQEGWSHWFSHKISTARWCQALFWALGVLRYARQTRFLGSWRSGLLGGVWEPNRLPPEPSGLTTCLLDR